LEEVTKEELQVILHSHKKDEIPSPDGWTIEFILGFDEIIGEDIIKVIHYSNALGRMLVSFNINFTNIIPKTGNPSST
jgi:hypothetical protein